jgi:hypothetical protein
MQDDSGDRDCKGYYWLPRGDGALIAYAARRTPH